MGDDRVTPTEPLRAPGYPQRNRLGTRPAAVAPPGPGNKLPPPKRTHSPPPVEDPQPTSADLGRKVAELGEARERAEAAESRAAELEAALRRERRKSAPAVESVAPEALVITRKGANVPSWVFWLAIGAIPVLGATYSTWKRFEVVLSEWDTTGKRISGLESRVHAAEGVNDSQRAELARERQVTKALECQLRHTRAAFERGGVVLDALPRGGVEWRSEYLPDPRKVRAAPAWRAVNDCPELPREP